MCCVKSLTEGDEILASIWAMATKKEKSVNHKQLCQLGVVVAFVLSSLAGCGTPTTVGPTKTIVKGQVTLDQKPVQNGQIIFTDAHGDAPRQYAGAIVDGKYEFESTPGEKRVEISARVTEGVQADPGANQRETIPERYNTKSTLTANIGEEKEEGVDFHLTTGDTAPK